MSGPVNVIKFKFDPAATLDRHWHILIDGTELTDLLEQAVKMPVPGHWGNKMKTLVNLIDLEKSLNVQGQLELLICANCAASGYRSCGDLGLKPFHISQGGEFIIWEVTAPNSDSSLCEEQALRFKFHRPQYMAEVKKVLEKKRSD